MSERSVSIFIWEYFKKSFGVWPNFNQPTTAKTAQQVKIAKIEKVHNHDSLIQNNPFLHLF